MVKHTFVIVYKNRYVRIGDWEAATVWRDRKIREVN